MKRSEFIGVTAFAVLGTLIVMGFLTADTRADTEAIDELLAIQQPSEPSNRYPITVTRVVDGDTLDAVISLGWDVSLTATIRCSDFDAWEQSKRRRSVNVTDEEVRKGKLATRFVVKALKDRRTYLSPAINGEDRDNYGRVLGRVFIQTNGAEFESLATIMQQAGHLRSESVCVSPHPHQRPRDDRQPQPRSIHDFTGWGGFLQSDFVHSESLVSY